jgi:hypothetical protein
MEIASLNTGKPVSYVYAVPRARPCDRTCMIAICRTSDMGGGLGDVCCWRSSSGRGVAVRLGAALPALDEPLSFEGIGKCTIPGRRGRNGNGDANSRQNAF